MPKAKNMTGSHEPELYLVKATIQSVACWARDRYTGNCQCDQGVMNLHKGRAGGQCHSQQSNITLAVALGVFLAHLLTFWLLLEHYFS